jgi:hypothetical protein
MLTTWSKLYTSQIGRGDSYAHHLINPEGQTLSPVQP